MKILMTGPFKDFSGYAHAGRNFAHALHNAGCDVVLRHIKYDDYKYEPTELESQLFEKPIRDCDIVFQMTTPNEIRYVPNKMNIAFLFWETTRIPKYWVDQLNLMDMVIVPCRFNAAVLTNCGVRKPVCVCHPVFDTSVYNKDYQKLDIPELKDKVVYYNICQFTAKKGIDVLLKSYFRAFVDIPDEPILVLKVYINMVNRQNEINYVKHTINQVKQGMALPTNQWPPVYIITEVMSDEDIYRLHKTGDVYVSSSRGEGWGVPQFESMAMGNVLVSHSWGGLNDFVNRDNAIVYGGMQEIVFNQNHPDPFLYTAMEEWFAPNDQQMMVSLRAVHEVLMGRESRHFTKDFIEDIKKRAISDTRKFDINVGGPRILQEVKKCYESWKSYGEVRYSTDEVNTVEMREREMS